MDFSRQEYWSGLPFPSPGYLPRDQTCISCIGRQILYHRATWEACLGLGWGHMSLFFTRACWGSDVCLFQVQDIRLTSYTSRPSSRHTAAGSGGDQVSSVQLMTLPEGLAEQKAGSLNHHEEQVSSHNCYTAEKNKHPHNLSHPIWGTFFYMYRKLP